MDTPQVLKQGDSFIRDCRYFADGINPTPLTTDIAITSSVKTSDGQLHALIVERDVDQVTNPGKYRIIWLDTQMWVLGTAKFDIQYITAGIKHSTDTQTFKIYEDITP